MNKEVGCVAAVASKVLRMGMRRAYGSLLILALLATSLTAPDWLRFGLLNSEARAEVPCPDTSQLPPATQSAVSTACATYQACFGSDEEALWFYDLAEPITQNGTVGFTTYHGSEGKLDVVYATTVQPPTAAASNLNVFIATMRGTAGETNICGFAMKCQQFFGDSLDHFIPVCEVSAADFAMYSEASRIQAGARVMSLANGQSKLVSSGPNPASMWGYPSDLSTLFTAEPISGSGNGGSAGGGGGTGSGDCDCVCLAYKKYQVAVDAAMNIHAIAVAAATALFLLALPTCASFSVGPLVGWLATAACIALAAAVLATAIAASAGVLHVSMQAAKQTLKLDLAACGVLIVEA